MYKNNKKIYHKKKAAEDFTLIEYKQIAKQEEKKRKNNKNIKISPALNTLMSNYY